MNRQELQQKAELHKAWLQGQQTGQRAIFNHEDLSYAPFDDLDFSRASFSHANLTCASMRKCNLSGAIFYGTDLTSANLTDSNLTHCCLINARLNNTILVRAKLNRAELRYCNITSAILLDADIKIYHSGMWPAIISKELTTIGCQKHTNDDWKSFSDYQISCMDSRALAYWDQNKKIIFDIMASF